MTSTHTRNVSGMHKAPRCEAQTAGGQPCRSPALTGEKLCHVHSRKGAHSRPGTARRGAYSKAALKLDGELMACMAKVDALIRKLDRGDDLTGIGEKLVTISGDLKRMIQQKRPGLDEPRGTGRLAEPSPFAGKPVDRSDVSFQALRNRARGAMLGLAVGSAFGVTLKNYPRDGYRELTDMLGGGKLGLKPGEWTGVTAMALALIDSLTSRRGLDETDFVERLLDWQENGAYSCTGACVGIGRTTRLSLEAYRKSRDPIARIMKARSAGNGSLVRLAPIAIRYWAEPDVLPEMAARQSHVTHCAPAAIDACMAFAEVLGEAISGAPRAEVLRIRYLPHAPSAEPILEGSWKDKLRDGISSSAYAIDTLEAALWCVGATTSFEEALVLAVNLGECADGVGAATGQLAGAIYGADRIPEQWLECLAWREHINEMTDALLEQGLTCASASS